MLKTTMMRMACAAAIPAAFTLAMTADRAVADEKLPAVSETNYKMSVGGGGLDPTTVYFVEGSATTPLGNDFGLQIDGLGGVQDNSGFGGGAAHLFWRDPSIGLVGLYGSGFANTAGLNYTVGNVGIEGALYIGQFSVEALVGAQFVNRLDTDIFGSAQLAFYPIDDLRLHGGYRYWFGEHIGMAGFEWQLPGQNDNSINFGLFADAQFREDEVGGWGGIRIYFGSQKPLIRRHREDDPMPLMPWDITLFTPPTPPPPAPPAGGGGGGNQEPPPPECPEYPQYPGYPMGDNGYPTASVTNMDRVMVKIPEECLQ